MFNFFSLIEQAESVGLLVKFRGVCNTFQLVRLGDQLNPAGQAEVFEFKELFTELKVFKVIHISSVTLNYIYNSIT